MRLIQCCIVAFLAAESIVSGQATASISGKLIPELINTPIPTAYVKATRSGLPPFTQTVLATANGSFQIAALPSGTYKICVSATGFLNPCEWNLPTLVVTLGAGQASTGNNLMIKPGTVAKLSIQDPSNLLNQSTTGGHKPVILAGVWTGSAANALLPTVLPTKAAPPPLLPTQFHAVHQTGTGNNGANYELAVPQNVSLIFHITSGDVQLANSQGVALANNVDQQLFQSSLSGVNSQSFSYAVIGLVAGK